MKLYPLSCQALRLGTEASQLPEEPKHVEQYWIQKYVPEVLSKRIRHATPDTDQVAARYEGLQEILSSQTRCATRGKFRNWSIG